jgi:probable HAF family extracellular repeat protein
MRLHRWTPAALLVLLAACSDEQPLGVDVRAPRPAPRAAGTFVPPTVVELGSLYGGYSIARDINDSGIVVGESDSRPFIWTAGEGMRQLPGLTPNGDGAATGINRDGWVVGWSRTSTGGQTAVKWSPTGEVQDIGAGLLRGSYATGINNLGQVVGTTSDAYYNEMAFIHDGGGATTHRAPGQNNCEGRAINDQGMIVLACNSYYGGARAFRYVPGAYEALDDMAGTNRNEAHGINGVGQIVGSAWGYTGGRYAAVWSRANLGTDLGGLGGDMWATDINDNGQVTGFYQPGGADHAVLWDATGIQDLGTAGRRRARALAINNRGDVVGHSDNLDNFFRAVLWKAAAQTLPPPPAPPVTKAEIEVSPGNIRLARTQQVTVHLLSSATFDAVHANAATVLLHLDGGALGVPVARRHGEPRTSVEDANGDGLADRAFTFAVSDLVAAGLTTGTRAWVLRETAEAGAFEAIDATPPAIR